MDLDDLRPQNPVSSQYTIIFFDKESNYSWAKFLTKQNPVFMILTREKIKIPGSRK